MNVNMCKRCGAANNLKYIYKGDYYCKNNRCLNLLFCRLVGDNCIIVKEKEGSCYDSYYNSRGEYIGDDTCTNGHIINQVPEVEKYVHEIIKKASERRLENGEY